MKKPRQKGFVLILVVTAIGLAGMEMFVLTGMSNAMLFESDAAYLRACERNLTASGLAWAKLNIKSQNKEAFGKTKELDVAEMNIQGGGLSITIGAPSDREAEVEISTVCTRARQTFRHSGKYRIGI
ncbi:MAG TPA: hypothetical protein VMW16_13920 [Sedimentisphaerales bacterium]|nr:hypothetical protein [Sedimentisphaerales bacterium]